MQENGLRGEREILWIPATEGNLRKTGKKYHPMSLATLTGQRWDLMHEQSKKCSEKITTITGQGEYYFLKFV